MIEWSLIEVSLFMLTQANDQQEDPRYQGKGTVDLLILFSMIKAHLLVP